MDKPSDMVRNIKNFWSEVVLETVKCEWPSRRALVGSTVVVIVTVVMMSLFVGASDRILLAFSRLLMPSGS